ncbi:non-ribosomal peptide synthetase [Pseudoalteromonas sp. PPB1]|uniref:non-ribosomal peptide synthetase n=1 Tax=Pseudoalteromonas sp. PPB1 TaxID=2756136 RepID=UPI00189196B1|nr:non-ribosomal peptide synthetase [Pseudoalteromonas sp. PPB1]
MKKRTIKELLQRVWQAGCQLTLKSQQLALSGNTKNIDRALLQEIKDHKSDIISYLSNTSDNLVLTDQRPAQLPPTASQSSLWMAHKLAELGNAYSMPLVKTFDSLLDIQRVEQAFHALQIRHEALRTNLEDTDGDVYQVIHQTARASVVHLTQEADLSAQVQRLLAVPFSLQQEPLIRLHCIRGEAQTTLVFNMHHVISDGVSLGILSQEFAKLYHGETLLPLIYHYADYAVAQAAWLDSPKLHAAVSALCGSLQDLPDYTNLPIKTARTAERSTLGETYSFAIEAAHTKLAGEVANRAQVTRFTVMMAAFFVMLNKVSSQDSLCIGVPFSNRQANHTDDMLGLFANTLPIAAHISGQLGFSEFVEQLQTQILDTYEWQGVPLDLMLNELKLKRSATYAPLFQVMFAYQNIAADPLVLDGVSSKDIEFDVSHIKYDLKLTIIEEGDELRAVFEYSSALFERDTIVQLGHNYLQVLSNLASAAPLSQWSLLSEADQSQLLEHTSNRSNDTPVSPLCLHQLYEQQVKAQPDFAVLKCGSETLSYAALDSRVNQLANGLIALPGYQAGKLIGVCTDRSFDMVAAILAVLKAGCAYVPLDPEYPSDRIAYICQDAALELVLTQPELSAQFEAMGVTPLNVSDTHGELWYQAYSSTEPDTAAQVTADQLAYIIYTSGSTGNPKGVMVEHGNAVAMLEWAKRTYSEQELAKVLASTSLCFDLSIYELFLPLCFGSQCVIVDNLIALLAEPVEVTLINSVPTAIELILEQDGLPSETLVVNSAGEPLSATLVNKLLSAGVTKVCNLYGPSEDTTYSTYAEFTSPLSAAPSIGRVIDNTQGYVLSEHNQLLPFGAVGELHLTGKGLARGYLNQPQLTDDKFITNPFYHPECASTSDRMYKTGDLVRYLPSGELEYIGRADEQVKLRGYRIELNEIKAQVESQLAVESALVVVRQSGTQKQLVAYLKPACEDFTPYLAPLKAALESQLPGYMVPDAFVVLENWPLLPNGKINKRALPEPELTNLTDNYVAPQTQLQTELVALWSALLSLPESEIGIRHNFFELGGNSILVAKMLSSIAKQYQVSISFTDVFNNAAIVELARYIEQGELSDLPQLCNTDPVDSLPASPQQIRYFETYNIDAPTSKRMTNTFDYWEDIEILQQAVQVLVEQNDIFHTGYDFDEQGKLRISFNPNPVVEPIFFTQEVESDHELQKAMYGRIAQETFELAHPPLLKLLICKSPNGGGHAVIGIFNGILDAYSGGLVTTEVRRLYNLIAEGKTCAAPDVAYRDFVQWQYALTDSEKYTEARTFWRTQYPDGFTPFYLTDHPQGSQGGTMFAFLLGETLSEQAAAKAKQTESSLFNFLLANFVEVASGWYKRDDVSVGLLYHGRDQAELEDKIGYFVDLLCLKAEYQAGQPFAQLVEQVNKNLFESIDNRIYQYQDLAADFGQSLTEPRFPLTGFHVNNVIVPGEEKQVPAHFEQQTAPLPYEPKFDFNIYVHESNRGILIRMAYANRILTAEEAEQFVTTFKNTVNKNSQ